MRMRACAVLTALLLVASSSAADIIHLVNGGEIRGTVIDRSGDTITVQTPGGVITLRAADVLRIEVETGPERFISEARQLASAGRLRDALGKLKEARAAGATEAEVRRLHVGFLKVEASRLEGEGRLAEAHALLVEAKQLAPGDVDLKAAADRVERLVGALSGGVQEARRAALSGDPVRAVQIYERILSESPSSIGGFKIDLVLAYVEASIKVIRTQPEQALHWLDRAVVLDPTREGYVKRLRILVIYMLAEKLRLGDDEDAIAEAFELSDNLLRDAPELAFVKFQRFQLLCARKRYVAARKILKEIVPEERRREGNYNGTAGFNRLGRVAAGIANASLTDYIEMVSKEKEEAAVVERGPERTLEGFFFDVVHRNENLARKVLKVADSHTEAILTKIGRGGQRPWTKRVQILCMVDRQTYLGKSGSPEWSEGSMHTKILGDGNTLRSINIFQTSPTLLTRTVPHEVAHVVFCALTEHTPRIPLTLHEGFAVSHEPSFDASQNSPLLLWKRLTGELMPVRELLMKKRVRLEVRLFYAQSASLVHFLVEVKDWETFMSFAAAVPSGSLDAAVSRFYPYRDVEELEKAWRDSLGR